MKRFGLCLLSLLVLSLSLVAAKKASLEELNYRLYPRRTAEEAAVLEWGHSAIISALDGSVAEFGPQTNQAALLEVECQPILGIPINGYDKDTQQLVGSLRNADEVHGNIVVMTNQQPRRSSSSGDDGVEEITGWDLAKIAKASGAAALLIVNVDPDHPDDIYRVQLPQDDPHVAKAAVYMDIPVVMISYTSGTVLTSATVTKDMKKEDIVNNGMPERVRLYAGGDRPFFEDVEPQNPTLYLIHQLLNDEESQSIIDRALPKLQPATKDNLLEYSQQVDKLHRVDRAALWQGMLQLPGGKAIEDRIEQVTGFPSAHFTDFMVDRYQPGSYWQPHYDSFPSGSVMATITVFLSDGGSPIVYPSASNPVKILPRRGMAIVHHNLDDQDQLDLSTVSAVLPNPSDEPIYIARKYILRDPVRFGRRFVLPLLALPLGGAIPSFVRAGHDLLLERFGGEKGSYYFDKACVFLPVLLIMSIVEGLRNYLQSTSANDKKTKKTKKQ